MDRDPVFTIKFTEGLAARRRLPLSHVLETLKQVAETIRDVGKRIQQEKGVENPTGDFGIELLAGRGGIAFREGSLYANAAITRDIENGIAAVREVLGTLDVLKKKRPTISGEARITALRGIAKIAAAQRKTRTVLTMRLHGNAAERGRSAKVDERALETLRAMESNTESVEGITVFGRLRQLTDRAAADSPGGMKMWGEIQADDGEKWRVKFSPQQYSGILSLFGKQVEARGTATYYQTKTPRLQPEYVAPDEPRDYVAAFDEIVGSERELYGHDSTESLIAEARGERG